MSIKDEITKALEGAASIVKDIVTLDVVTLTGDITIKASIKDTKIDLQKLYKAIEQKADVEGGLQLIAFTHIDADADSINFVKKDLSAEQKGLLIAHNESVKAAQEARTGFVAMVRSLFP